ncbi:NADPH-dependent FMN reductase [Marinobacter nanhaiticus D15-8W]|uniref:NADPH-dependent oxidoreductase n=1 Tax=Marinobacter nanhaiticus D15-8W TaxID=626887 RepID=N6VZQ5_9GAMM|nr:NAD(P)H-dependent oxidoreductase [Marinobacter nanhaiticus]ENO15750.1 NADPH-dependent oxidoreductase [Marinobacter nanhaiticus D15-8W]BES73392.1 NADPH-dependent FMN reductase [Marinobacter nanhaiticus D15-8W]
MSGSLRILFIAGSTRTGSFNAQLAERAAHTAEQRGDVTVTLINLADYDMPLYNGDLEKEKGLPEAAKKLKQQFRTHHGFCLASPEYNSTISPLLINALHWISRPETQDEPGLVAFKGKVAGLLAASPGGFGGMRGLVPLRMMLGNIGVHVIPTQLAVPQANNAFDESGAFKEESWQQRLEVLVDELVATAEVVGTAEG